MTAPELKPCPFCGGIDVKTQFDDEQGQKWGYAECETCCAASSEVRTGYDTGDDAPWRYDAMIAWNTRTDLCDPMQDPRVVALVAVMRRIISDTYWRTNDNTLYPDACAALAATGTK